MLESSPVMQVEQWSLEIDGPLSEETLCRKLSDKGYEVTRYVYPPGSYFSDHPHEIDKLDAVLCGRFRMTLGGQSVVLQAGDCLFVPRGVVHSAAVIGDEPVVSLDASKSG